MSLTVHLAFVFHVFIAVADMVMVCAHHGIGRSVSDAESINQWYRTLIQRPLNQSSQKPAFNDLKCRQLVSLLGVKPSDLCNNP